MNKYFEPENFLPPDHLYRIGVGIMIINNQKEIFVGKRIDNNSDAWQMPQGGIDAGENEDEAMFRELKEETGILLDNIKILQKSKSYHYYNLPYNLQKKFWKGKYLGQKQKWYIVQFIGDENLINIKTEHPEFSDWRWISKEKIISTIVDFKQNLYQSIIDEFKEFL
jgi:putative (di)nucleoside polyphosphate hydrolase